MKDMTLHSNKNNTLIVVFDNKNCSFRVVNLLDKTISFSSFNKKCDAENLMNDMIYVTTEQVGGRLK